MRSISFIQRCSDADPCPWWDLCVGATLDKFTWTTACGEKEESALTLSLTGFYCFSGHITLRMVLIYYAQVHFRWLLFTENKGEDVADYIKKEGYLQM